MIYVSGDWDSSGGTFTCGTGEVIFDGAGTSTIAGTTFYDFTCTTPGKTLQVTTGNTETILNALTLTGANGNLITLESTAEGSTFDIDPQGSWNVSYTQVRDSNNINGGYIFPYGADRKGSIDLGNTDMWFEGAGPNPPPPPIDPPIIPPTEEPDGGGLINMDPYYQGQKWDKQYQKGKYKTVVIVFEGKVAVAPYDSNGPMYSEGVLLTAGETYSTEGSIPRDIPKESQTKAGYGFDMVKIQNKPDNPYDNLYLKNKYRTTVTSIEGTYVVTPYTKEKGPNYKDVTTIHKGESTIVEKEV